MRNEIAIFCLHIGFWNEYRREKMGYNRTEAFHAKKKIENTRNGMFVEDLTFNYCYPRPNHAIPNYSTFHHANIWFDFDCVCLKDWQSVPFSVLLLNTDSYLPIQAHLSYVVD